MDWRQFKTATKGKKEEKEEKPPFATLNTFFSTNTDLKTAPAATPRTAPPEPTGYRATLTEESARRFDFCTTHRQLLGGACRHLDVMDRRTPGDPATALDGCLLWQLVRCGQHIERAGAAEVLPGMTVADVLCWVTHSQDVDAIRKERRLLLTCAVSMRGTIH